MAILLPRARLNLSSPAWDCLPLSEQQKQSYQSLLDQSEIEKRLSKQFQQAVYQINTTAILPSEFCLDEMEHLGIAKRAPPDIIIFVSKNAALLGRLFLSEPQLASAKLFSVGRSAASFFPEVNIQSSGMGRENANGLLQLDDMQVLADKTIWIIKGEQGLDDLEQVCRQRGACVEVFNLYVRKENTGELNEHLGDLFETTEFIYGVSVYALEHLLKLCDAKTRLQCMQLPMKAMSQRIASAAEAMGFLNVTVSELTK